MLPDCTVHGVWVRSLVHDAFGRICYKVVNRTHQGSVEFMVMWQPDADLGTKNPTAGYQDPWNLEVRPYKPKPWYKGTLVKEVVYDDTNADENYSTVSLGLWPQSDLPIGDATRLLREGRGARLPEHALHPLDIGLPSLVDRSEPAEDPVLGER